MQRGLVPTQVGPTPDRRDAPNDLLTGVFIGRLVRLTVLREQRVHGFDVQLAQFAVYLLWALAFGGHWHGPAVGARLIKCLIWLAAHRVKARALGDRVPDFLRALLPAVQCPGAGERRHPVALPVAHRVDDDGVLFTRCRSQRPANLLQVLRHGFSRASQDHRHSGGHVEPLVEQVDVDQQLGFSGGVVVDRVVSLARVRLTAQCLCSVTRRLERPFQLLGGVDTVSEHDRLQPVRKLPVLPHHIADQTRVNDPGAQGLGVQLATSGDRDILEAQVSLRGVILEFGQEPFINEPLRAGGHDHFFTEPVSVSAQALAVRPLWCRGDE
ncbi:hypothetical protein D3C73_855670 [compost metagenome]